MNKSYDKDIFSKENFQEFLNSIGWNECFGDLLHQNSFNFQELTQQLLTNKIDCFIYPLTSIPFERDENIQLAAVSSRRDEAFYLQNSSEIKNISFLGESQKILYNTEVIRHFVRDINEKVVLEHRGIDELSDAEIAIHVGNQWSEKNLTRLSVEEFTPPPASGVYAMICRKTDTTTRKKMATFHQKELMDITNLERKIQLHYHKRKDIHYIGARIEKDSNAYFHGTVAILEKTAEDHYTWRYFHHSQSTTDQFIANILHLA